MSTLDDAVWRTGISYGDFRSTAKRHKDVLDEVWNAPDYSKRDFQLLKKLPPLRVVAIAEDWCPDVVHTLPTWAHLVGKLPRWELRVFARDAEPELMEPFLWRGTARRIPVYAFYDKEGRLQVWWSGRGAEAQAWLDDKLAGRGYDEIDEAERARLSADFGQAYRERFRASNFREVRALLGAFFHLPIPR